MSRRYVRCAGDRIVSLHNRVGLRELNLSNRKHEAIERRVHRPGGGRRLQTCVDPDLLRALESLVEPVTRGDPDSSLRRICKSTRRLAEDVTRQYHPISSVTVGRLLRESGYSLKADPKTREVASHPDRNAQFEYINSSVGRVLRRGCPAISVDTKKKELVGVFSNSGQT